MILLLYYVLARGQVSFDFINRQKCTDSSKNRINHNVTVVNFLHKYCLVIYQLARQQSTEPTHVNSFINLIVLNLHPE